MQGLANFLKILSVHTFVKHFAFACRCCSNANNAVKEVRNVQMYETPVKR